jgi:hypothetical protein
MLTAVDPAHPAADEIAHELAKVAATIQALTHEAGTD